MNPCGSVSQNSCASLRPGFQSSAAAHSTNVATSAGVSARMAGSLSTDVFVESVASFLDAVALQALLPSVELLRLCASRTLKRAVRLQHKAPPVQAVVYSAGAL